jgi:hypothetical protein
VLAPQCTQNLEPESVDFPQRGQSIAGMFRIVERNRRAVFPAPTRRSTIARVTGSTSSCSQCGTGFGSSASRFCGTCGLPRAEEREDPEAVRKYEAAIVRLAGGGGLDERALQQLDAVRGRIGISLATHDRLVAEHAEQEKRTGSVTSSGSGRATLRAFVDVSTVGFFEVGSRCMLRLQLHNDGELAVEPSVHAEVLGDGRIAAVVGTTLFPAQSQIVALWLVPRVAGFQELSGIVEATDLVGERSFHRFDGVLFRVGGADGPRVSVVNVDQSSARVVDNSKSQFGGGGDAGGMVGEATWQPIALRAIPIAEARRVLPEIAPASSRPAARPAADDRPVRAPQPRSRSGGGHIAFTVKAGEIEYAIDATLAHGDLAMVYGGKRKSDGARVAVKVADDPGDNDLIAAEVRALRLLRAEQSPQLKHLPVVLDSFRTSDGRAGTILEELDGLDLVTLKERLAEKDRASQGALDPRHMIWLMRRCLSVLGWAHSRGVLHGNLDPAHVMVRAQDHNVWLIDWCYAIVNPTGTGESFRCLNEEYSAPEVREKKPPLPSADLYSLGKCMIYAAGGDVARGTLPDSMDERLQRFIKFLIVDSALGRAQDAWSLYAQLDKLREQIYGAHQFVALEV